MKKKEISHTMKKVTIAAFIIGSFILYSFIYHANSVALVPNNSTN